MKGFAFQGVIPASKSLMNRALIAQSYHPELILRGDSACDDVVHLRDSLRQLGKTRTFECGEGGTTLRFLAFRLSRIPGSYLLKAKPSLLRRPQKEIKNILNQLGVEVRLQKNGIRISSKGWQQPKDPVRVDAEDSSQFLSALFLNAWDLEFDLKIKTKGAITSESYFNMTTQMLKSLGLRYSKSAGIFRIPAEQKVRAKSFRVESDLSSTFSVAAFAALSGSAKFKSFPEDSLQPDKVFLKVFKLMNIPVKQSKGVRQVKSSAQLRALRFDLKNSPDLFPVLAVLCAFATGESVLFGAPQLVNKESDRIAKTSELLTKAGFACEARKDGMKIFGGGYQPGKRIFVFDPANDHRLAMAAALLKFQGFNIRIRHPDVVNKSFPEFWKYVGVRP